MRTESVWLRWLDFSFCWTMQTHVRCGLNKHWTRFVRVLENLESPGNLLNTSNKVFRIYVKKKCRRIDFEILGMRGFMGKIGFLENQSESWKSPGNLFLKKGTNPDWIASVKSTVLSFSTTHCGSHTLHLWVICWYIWNYDTNQILRLFGEPSSLGVLLPRYYSAVYTRASFTNRTNLVPRSCRIQDYN